MTTTRISVRTPAPYEVIVGHGLLGELAALLGPRVDKVAVINPAGLAATGDAIREDLEAQGFKAIALEVPDGEEQKNAEVASFCWGVLGQEGFTRTDAIVSVGGGATTDLAGFVAATWLRGVGVVHIPTTVLAMVDAAIGGKTGINTPSGKNLVGAIHEPRGVLCDLSALETLGHFDVVAGLAEAIKAGFIADTEILALFEANPQACTDPTTAQFREVIERAIRVKADIVAHDLHESLDTPLGREVLNYGHTFGHAVELAERYSWRHGAAVSVGMMFVAELARLAGHLDDAGVEQHRRILTSVGLPVTYGPGQWDKLLGAMKVDKKARGDLLRFIVLNEPGKPALLEGPDPVLLAAAYAEVSQS
ncbi:MAG: 3-dehydroquinate synthase [Actinomycetes bacterium]|jgi:3-dehydroquinate synthase|nr:3-dehydroquinate synthase [Candidatus Nanopelagicales bacterium]MDP4825936.1 3-dehydroquinate synthase [Candidatus Nanopelagicales bacterium]MDP4888796.1 3-dehydroquinate synthase [Candidatus Nanopelagicales bacterium]